MALQELITLVIFTIILAKSSEVVVDSAVKLAKFFRVRTLAIGMLLIAVSTSLPELAVSVTSSAAHEGSIAAGNVFGSNIANILLIAGAAAFLYGFRVQRETMLDLALVLLLTTMISVYIIFHSYIFGQALGFYEGALLLLIAAWYAFRMLKRNAVHENGGGKKISKEEGLKAFLFFFGGVLAVIVSSSLVVSSAVRLAEILGLAKSFIGATLIAVGTSLPELSVDLQAFRKKQYGLALGDAIGSNMANITLVLGAAAVISPIVVQLQVFIAALLFAVIANMLFFYIAAVNKAFKRNDGLAMWLLYLLYIIVIFYLQFSEPLRAAG